MDKTSPNFLHVFTILILDLQYQILFLCKEIFRQAIIYGSGQLRRTSPVTANHRCKKRFRKNKKRLKTLNKKRWP